MAKKFEVTILGVNSAYPVHGRHPSCQIINYDDRLIMIDCGEGSQIQLSKYHIKRSKITDIFISHMHGDHCLGLPGLLTSYSLQSRNDALHLHGPVGIRDFIENIFRVTGAHMTYPLQIFEYDTEIENSISVTPNFSVITFPLRHRGSTMGFKVQEHINEFNIDTKAIKKFDLNIDEIKSIKQGNDLIRGMESVANEKLTLPREKERSYAYCSDTVYFEELADSIRGCDLIYHETTYLDDLIHLAADRMHTTLGQAIQIAKLADVQRMIIGHYSSRYNDPGVFLEEGKSKYEGLILGEEGVTYPI